MAKKKIENIKAAPVLRAQGGGDDPTPITPIITKSYCVRDDWKDQDIVNYVAFKSVDGEVQDLTVNGQPAGGGDLRTAQVTFINTGSTLYSLPLPTLSNGHAKVTNVHFIPNDPNARPTTVIIGANGCYSTFDDFPTTAKATGGVRYDDGDVYITGDGTLTIS